ncbi:MAG: LysM peptidoglycan-binding domain-containing protein [Bacteroidota bacterium]
MKNTTRLRLACLFFMIGMGSIASATGDSTRYLTLKDTIFLQLGSMQEKSFIHNIAPKQTLFSMAKFYGLKMEELYFYNPEIRDQVLTIGHPIRIPIPNRAILRYKKSSFDESKHIPVCYIVQRGDNLYDIAKRVFRMPVDTVMGRNNMPDYTLSIGQTLLVGWMSIDGISAKIRAKSIPPEWRKSYQLQKRFMTQKSYKKDFQEQGVAFWNKNSKSKSDLYALHRRAPINSIIGVNNPMNNRTVYVKVIGRIPSNVYADNVKVVLSPRAVRLLGARDSKFFIRLEYLK